MKKRAMLTHVSTGGASVPRNHERRQGSDSPHHDTLGEKAWVHWEYTPDEWALLDRLDWMGTARWYWLRAGLVTLCLLGFIALFVRSVNVSDTVSVIAFLGIDGCFVVLVFLLASNTAFRKARKRHNARQKSSLPHKVTLAEKGIWEAGTFFPLKGSGVEPSEINVELLDVQLASQPTMLLYRVKSLSIAASGRGGAGRATRKETIRLLVPAAYESEAERVLQQYRSGIVKARDLAQHVHESLVNPPEPD